MIELRGIKNIIDDKEIFSLMNRVILRTLFLVLCLISFILSNSFSQELIHLSPNSHFYVSPNATVKVNGSFLLSSSSSFTVGNGSYVELTGDLTNTSGSFTTSSGTFVLGGDFVNNGYFLTGSGMFLLNGSSSQTFTGTGDFLFDYLALNKTGGSLFLFADLTINTYLRLLSNSIVEIGENNLTIGESGSIYSDLSTGQTFDANKNISTNSSTLSGFLNFNISAGSPVQEIIEYPLGTSGVYTPAKITLNNATFSSGANIGIRAISIEHPKVETNNASLTKYWNISKSNVSIPNNGADLLFTYDPTEVNGNEGSFLVLLFNPAYPDPLGYWTREPGQSNQVLFNNSQFYSQEVDDIDGDWTAGEEDAAISTYYSRADGDYNDNTTWSKDAFGGAISPTIPNKQSDRVLISNNSVTITDAIAPANLLEVESGGKLTFAGNYHISGDTMRVLDDAVIECGNQWGIAETSNTGCVQTTVRDLSTNVVYIYSGTFTTQNTGDGIPDDVRSIVLDKPDGTRLILDKIVDVNDSLVINTGSFDINNKSINGSSSSRTLTMRGGELIVRSSFPTNYSPPTFTSGTITFDKDGNNLFITIPSSSSTPAAVAQYNVLVLKGNRTGASTVTFPSQGEINISNILDISQLEFDSSIPRFSTDGSTVVFMKNGGVQNIPCSPGTVDDSIRNINYYNLKIAGSGTKQLSSPFNPTFIVVNDFTLESSTFTSNGYNFEVNQNWINTGGVFDPGNDAVILRSAVPILTNTITSRSTTDNPFNDVVIAGSGYESPVDDMLIKGDLIFESGSQLTLASSTASPITLELKGNWYNRGGTFSPNTSTVTFTGASSQTITNTSGDENFATLRIDNNGKGIDATTVGPNSTYGVNISDYLDLNGGILTTRGRFAKVSGQILRNGASPGHVDGALRKSISANSSTVTFEVGYGTSYTPVVLAFSGTGGTEGFLNVLSDTITTSSSPVSTNGSSLLPAGSNIDDTKDIRRQWTVSIPPDSTFVLGAGRTFNINNYFVSGVSPAGDVRGGADPLMFETRYLSGSSWHGPDRYGTPRTGTRSSDNTEFELISSLGTFVIGEPEHLSFYSISSGSWSTASNWSTQHYYGTPSAIVPTNDGYIYIGNSKTITMYNDKTVNGFVIIDSAGTLMCENNIVSGSGSFTLYSDGAMGIGNANGITQSAATGNIQTSSRDYNYNGHNTGHFVYTGNTNDQPSGDGLPPTVATLTVDKTSGSRLRLTNDMLITDSLSIVNGELYAREPGTATARDIVLTGNLYLTSSGTFDPYQGEFTFRSSSSQTVTAQNDMSFYDLTINNDGDSTKIWFKATNSSDEQNITILNQLAFAPTNKAYIDLSAESSSVTGTPNYNSGEWYMTIDQSATGVVRLGEGHVAGELRKWVPLGDFTEIMFEVGHNGVYSPFAFDLDLSGGTAGYVGVQVVPQFHPEGDYLDDASYNYQPERIIQKYWRVTRPDFSSFAQGSRNIAMRCRYRDPEDIPGGALKLCFDLVYWMGGLSSNWQRLSPPDPGSGFAEFNDGSGSSCGDRTILNDEATYSPNGRDTSTTAYSIDGSSISLGNTDLGLSSNDRYLVADVLVGQQGPPITYYYSRQDGAWNDANTWSTVSYTSSTNSTNSWPKRRLDVAMIGDGHKVTLNCNIGSGYAGYYTTPSYYEQRLGSCVVEESANGRGELDLGTYQIRASVFELHDGGILSTGSEFGFPDDLRKGNLIRQYQNTTISRDLNYSNHNNGNFIFTAKGETSETYNIAFQENYCNVRSWYWYGNSDGGYIDDIMVDNGASYSSPNVFAYMNNGIQRNWGDWTQSDAGFRYWCDTTVRFTAGNQYTMRVQTANANGFNCRLWIDTDFDGTYDDPGERYGDATISSQRADLTFTIPAGTTQGTTRLRVKIINDGTASHRLPCWYPTSYSTDGEVEDYTVFITKSGYTMVQPTGNSVPDQIASITIAPVSSSSTVTQTSGLSVADSVDIESGTFIPTTYPNNTSDFSEIDFIASADTYSTITDGTAPALSGGTADDGYYSNIPIGFTFSYIGNNYTTVSASTNGFLSFGTPAAVPGNDLDANGGTARPVIAPLWDDLDMSSGQFSYKTTGHYPDRIFIAQWENVEWNASAASPVISFQAKLYENSGNIEYVYSQKVGSVNSGSASIGVTGTATGAGNFMSLNNTSTAPSISRATSTNNLNTKPAEGQSYTFSPRSAMLNLQGNFVNNANANSFGEGSQGTIEFNGTSDQDISGSINTDFYNVRLNNTGNSIKLNQNAKINDWLSFEQDNFLELNQKDLTMGVNALAISPSTGSFSSNRMIMSSTSATVGSVTKEFPSTSGAKDYFFPIGVSSDYNPADISITGTYTGTPSYTIALYSGLHPKRLKDQMLSKYWNFSMNGISSVTANSMTYTYLSSDVNGDSTRYIPALYRTTGDWEINVGTGPKAYPKPIEITNTSYIEGDWTAGEADVFFEGRIFWSINTGDWNVASNWSNDPILKHNGPPASYYPSEIYVKDTVIVDGHTIDYNVDDGTIDTMRVGGPNKGVNTAGRGIVDFVGDNSNKYHLTVSRNLFVDTDGRVNSSSTITTGRRDTLTIDGNLINYSDGTAGIDGGMYLFQNSNDWVVLQFGGTTSSTITGEGFYGNPFAEVRITKDNGLSDTLTCKSNTFAAATGSDPYLFYFDSGVLTLSKSSSSLSLPDATFSLSSSTFDVDMQPNSGINVEHGTMLTANSLHNNINTDITINGGDLIVGDAVDEHLLYQTGSTLAIKDGYLDIAGCFEKISYKYIIDMSIEPNGVVRVLRKGNTDIAKIGYNISNASSTYSMNGGRVIIANSTGSNSSDYDVGSTFGTGMINGATVQTGDTLLSSGIQEFKLAGTSPIYNLHSVAVGSKTIINQQTLIIDNDWSIDANHTGELSDNTLYLGGDLLNSGSFTSNASVSSTDARQLVLTGSSNTQTIYNKNAGGIEFYNLRLDKAGGKVLLGADNSNIIVRNTLEFASDNQAVIDSRTNNQYVEVSPTGTSSPTVIRNGLGHIDGLMYRYFAAGTSTKKFDVGADTAASYRPVTIALSGTGGTAGLFGVYAHNSDHTDIANSNIKLATNIQRYWTTSYLAPFALGSRTYAITTQYMNPGDIRGTPNLSYFEHALYNPALPSSPPTSTWTKPSVYSATDSSVTSDGITIFGDFVTGEPLGIYYYSYQTGNWNDLNSWSHDSYLTKTTPVTTLPGSGSSDYVYIGNGKTITLQAGGPYPTVKSIVIEKYNNLPGSLYINGQFGYVKGDNFLLEDDCTLGMQNMSGIIPTGNIGAVRMSILPEFKISRYVYNSIYGKQNSGKALPGTIKTLIADNQSASPNNVVFLSSYSGAPSIYVNDTVRVDHGILNSGNRDLHLYGHLIFENSSSFEPLTGNLTFNSATFSPPSHTISLGNQAGANFYNLKVKGGNVVVSPTASANLSTAHIYVANDLEFDNASDLTINVRDNNRKVIMASGATVTRTQSTGFVDGILQKPVTGGSGSYLFEIGNGTAYTPATLTFDAGAGGVAGSIDAVNEAPVPDEPYSGNRLDLTHRVNRYWSLTGVSGSGFDMGSRTANLKLEFPASELSGLTMSQVVVRRKSIPAETPLWSQRVASELTWNTGVASVELNPLPTDQWPGIGEFYIGIKAPRTFYSLQTGNWDENTTWTFNSSHIGSPVAAGDYPNQDDTELEDNVEIGLDHIVTLNVAVSKIDTLKVIGTSDLDMQTNSVNCIICAASGLFELADNATISFGANSVPSATSTMINFATYTLGSNTTIEFYGTQTLPADPFGLALYSNNVLINQVGTKTINTPLIIQGNLTISNNAVLQINNIDAAKVNSNVINNATLINNGVLEIGN